MVELPSPTLGPWGYVLFRDIKDIRDIYDIYDVDDTLDAFIFLLEQT